MGHANLLEADSGKPRDFSKESPFGKKVRPPVCPEYRAASHAFPTRLRSCAILPRSCGCMKAEFAYHAPTLRPPVAKGMVRHCCFQNCPREIMLQQNCRHSSEILPSMKFSSWLETRQISCDDAAARQSGGINPCRTPLEVPSRKITAGRCALTTTGSGPRRRGSTNTSQRPPILSFRARGSGTFQAPHNRTTGIQAPFGM